MQTKYFDWLSAASASLKIKFQESGNIQHSGSKGSAREDHVRDFIRRVLPKKFGVSRGEIVNSQGVRSCECDIIIYDQNIGHPIIEIGDQKVFPVECVFGVIEVKSTLNSKEIDDCLRKAKTLKVLRPAQTIVLEPAPGFATGVHSSPIFFDVFAFESTVLNITESIHKKIENKDEFIIKEPDNREEMPIPNMIITLDDSLVVPLATNTGYHARFGQLPLGANALAHYYAQLYDSLNAIKLPTLRAMSYLAADISE